MTTLDPRTTTAHQAPGPHPVTAQTPVHCADAADWFHVADLGDGITLVAEPGHVTTFLVQGTDRALLVDAGTGLAPISQVVRTLTDLPLLVVTTHDHLDHRGGVADLVAHADVLRLEGVAAHESAVSPAGHPAADHHGPIDPAFLAHYAAALADVHADFLAYDAIDSRSFYTRAGLWPGGGAVRPMPDTTAWHVPAVAPTVPLTDGQTIDLGGRTLTVLHTPGHSPDSICLLDEATGTLLSGDTLIAAASWLHGDGADLAAFATSTARLAALDLRRILPAHNLAAQLPGTYAAAVARTAALVAAGQTAGTPGHDMLGHPVTRHTHDGITLLLPPAAPGAPTVLDPAQETA